MKKRSIIVLILLCCIASLAAQPRLMEREYYLGVHGGATASTMLFKPKVTNMTPITNAVVLGGNGGLVFRYAGHKYCGLQVELNYMQRGWREKGKENDVDYSRRLHYVEIPFMSHIYFGDKVRGYLNIGPEIGFCVAESAAGTPNDNLKEPYQYGKVDKPFDWGFIGALGICFRTPHAGLYQLEARFDYSLGDVFNTRATDYFSAANPIDLSINLAWMWEFKNNKKHK